MKKIIFFLSITAGLFTTAIISLIGFASFIYKVWHGQDYMESFQLFSLSAILCITSITAYIVIKILTSTELIGDILQKFFELHIHKNDPKPKDPDIMNLIQGLFSGGLPDVNVTGRISVSSFDNDGNETSLGDKSFNNQNEFIKYRNELLGKDFRFTQKDMSKKLENMSIEELKKEENKAIDTQNFELAGAIRDIIKEKESKNN